MRLLVAPARWVSSLLTEHRVDWVVSLISPDAPGLSPPADVVFRFNDIDGPRPGLVPPTREDVEAILALAKLPLSTLLLHCHAGISRSTAAAYALACQKAGPGQEEGLAKFLRGASPEATPNRLMVALADELLERDGAMVQAIAALGRGIDAYEGSVFDWRL